jgi:multiple sugar transport system ATP-binding protein
VPGIDISDVTKVYPGGVKALDALQLTIHDGEFFALLGPSGCGKTTLLRTIAGLESATAGMLRIGTRDITDLPPGERHVAMVFQDYALYPHMTVRDNIAYPLRIKKVGRTERAQRAESAGDSLSLGGLMDRRPGQLSGGQQQRVALARAVATRPDVFLFDEPLSNLDARLRLEARTFLKQLQRELATTAVFVTHDQSEALALADRMAVMESGVIRQVGTPSELFHRPANLFVAGFIGSTPMNLLPGVVADGGVDVDGALFPIVDGEGPRRLDLGREVYYGIRPEYVAIDHTGVIGGSVLITENLGTSYLVTVDLGSTQVRGTVEEGSEPAQGDTVALTPTARRVLLFDRADGTLIGSEGAP